MTLNRTQTVMRAITLTLFLATASRSAEIVVDGSTCSLTDAIVAANDDTGTGGCAAGDTGADTIILDADVTLTSHDPSSTDQHGGFAGLPDITDDLTIRAGLGSRIERDPGFTCNDLTADPVFRLLNLSSGSLLLEGLDLAGGCLVSSIETKAAAVYAAEGTDLHLENVTVEHIGVYATAGVQGSAIHFAGLESSFKGTRFENIHTEATAGIQGGAVHLRLTGTSATFEESMFRNIDGTAGSNSSGTVIYAGSLDELTIADSTFDAISFVGTELQGGVLWLDPDSTTITDTSFSGIVVHGSTGGVRGGAVRASGGSITLQRVHFHDIQATSISQRCEGGALSVFAVSMPLLEDAVFEDIHCSGTFAFGGAVRITGSDSVGTIRRSVFRNIETLFGADGEEGGKGHGGALYSFTPITSIENTTFTDNLVAPLVATSHGDAEGGALWINEVGSLSNLTVTNNTVRAGSGETTGSDGGDARGGGIVFVSTGSVTTFSGTHLTVAGNQAIAGPGGSGFADGVAQGGGVYVGSSETVEIGNSILANNQLGSAGGSFTDQDCFNDAATVSTLGFNLAENPDPSCTFGAGTDIVGLDPSLYPTDGYGCVSVLPGEFCIPTAPIDQDSAGLDAGSCTQSGATVDGRGFGRPEDVGGVTNIDDGCDIGAFEAKDSDDDWITDVPDVCPFIFDPGQEDMDKDGAGAACDCDDGDPLVQVVDNCGVCGGDDSTCSVFADGFESGDVIVWSSVTP